MEMAICLCRLILVKGGEKMNSALEKILQWTPQRKTVFSVISNSGKKHLTAEEIYLMSKKIMPTIGLATIYRTLDLFCKEGILQRLNLPAEPTRYELLEKDNNVHCHYVCLGCGKIFEEPMEKESSLEIAENDSIKNFTITNKSYWYSGYCRDCMDK
jgi:Fur family ferric uptake transcriptional regulator